MTIEQKPFKQMNNVPHRYPALLPSETFRLPSRKIQQDCDTVPKLAPFVVRETAMTETSDATVAHTTPHLAIGLIPDVEPNQHIEPQTYQVTAEGQAVIGGVEMNTLAETYGTPLYVLDGQTFRTMAQLFKGCLKQYYPQDAKPLYACKANFNMTIAKLAEQQGFGLDVVSGGELYTALQAGVSPSNILFNGNNKSLDELEMAIAHQVERIIVDNPYELELIHDIAEKRKRKVSVLLRISPGIECHTHDYIKTGQIDSKFGFLLQDLPPVIERITTDYKDTLSLTGLHAHIGSQIFETKPYEDLVEIMLNLYYNIRANYDGLVLTDLNLGGGYGIRYTEKDDPIHIPQALKAMLTKLVAYAEKLNYPLPRLFIEPGRSLVATAGVTLYTIGGRKIIPGVRQYVSVDGGMGDNLRPALYQAEYHAVVANKANSPVNEVVTVCGKYCESGDVLINRLAVPASLESGDILLVFDTGAYNAAMASNYNRIGRPPTVWVENGQHYLITRRETLEHLCALDLMPDALINSDDFAS